MIGTLHSQHSKATIVGAGISGLLIAYRLKQLGYEVQVLEQSHRAGGLIQTRKTPDGLVECAAHSLLVPPETEVFFRELGLELEPVDSKSRARFIVRDRKPQRLPLRFFELIQILWRFLFGPKKSESHEIQDLKVMTLAEFGDRYLGKPATQFLLAPFVSGVFACRPQEIETAIAFPKLLPTNPNQSLFSHLRRSPKKPRPKMMVLKGGMESLTQALAQKLEGSIRYGHTVESIAPYLNDQNLILTTPAQITAQLLENLDPQSSSALQQVRYSPLVTCTLFCPAGAFKNGAPRGVGVLIPREEPYRILGVLYNSSAFPSRVTSPDQVSLTIMLGGSTDPEAILLTDSEIKSLIQNELYSLLGLRIDAASSKMTLHITRWNKAIPIFNHSLTLARSALSSGFCSIPGRIVFSNYSDAVSIRGMIETILPLQRPQGN